MHKTPPSSAGGLPWCPEGPLSSHSLITRQQPSLLPQRLPASKVRAYWLQAEIVAPFIHTYVAPFICTYVAPSDLAFVLGFVLCTALYPMYPCICLHLRTDPKRALKDFSISLLLDDSANNAPAVLHRGILYSEMGR